MNENKCATITVWNTLHTHRNVTQCVVIVPETERQINRQTDREQARSEMENIWRNEWNTKKIRTYYYNRITYFARIFNLYLSKLYCCTLCIYKHTHRHSHPSSSTSTEKCSLHSYTRSSSHFTLFVSAAPKSLFVCAILSAILIIIIFSITCNASTLCDLCMHANTLIHFSFFFAFFFI